MDTIAIFDIGKTNKKLFLFDKRYKIVWERSEVCEQTVDEDGDPCEDIGRLTEWVYRSMATLATLKDFRIRAINFSAYGASFVYIGEDNRPIAPLYNYLKPYPEELKEKFYTTYGGEAAVSMLTASPVLGSLNSGMQLYRIKTERPELFARIKYALHLPQYLSFLFTGVACSDITSIGCHTMLWNFPQQRYHEWVYKEGLIDKLAPILSSASIFPVKGPGVDGAGVDGVVSGIGLHDSSAAMVPYRECFCEPFGLVSTGTWCISLNPFNDSPLTAAELQKDCLSYMSYQGQPVKASRLFAGYEHEQAVNRLAVQFHTRPEHAAGVVYDPACVERIRGGLADYESFEEAYHGLMLDIMEEQEISTRQILQPGVRRLFVDGGFARNQVYMHLFAEAFPGIEVYTASIPQATAMGAALAIHPYWHGGPLPGDMIELKYYK